MLKKFAMGFSKALSTAPALSWAGCTNTAPAAVHKGKTGPLQGIHEEPTARGETEMHHCWHTPITHRQEEEGLWKWMLIQRAGEYENSRKFFYVCMEEGVTKQNTWKLIAE